MILAGKSSIQAVTVAQRRVMTLEMVLQASAGQGPGHFQRVDQMDD